MHFNTNRDVDSSRSIPKSPTTASVLNIIKEQDSEIPDVIETGDRYVQAKEKILKQLSNIYKNTRMSKFTLEQSPVTQKIEYKRVKGLVLNVEKRMCWYLNIEEGTTRCLLISTKARTSSEDLIYDNGNIQFNYYCKFIFTSPEDGQKKFISIPLFHLNIMVV